MAQGRQASISRDDDVRFEVSSILGKNIRTTEKYWDTITEIKHPRIRGLESKVKKVLSGPDFIRQSTRDEDVFLYYRKKDEYFLCVVARHLDGEGFVVTAYLTDRVKAGKLIYEKNS